MRTRFLAPAVVALLSCAAIALAASTATIVVHNKSTVVRSVEVSGQWYLNADDVARALGRGASFSASTRTLYTGPAPAPAPPVATLPRTESRVGGPWASDGSVAVHVVSLRSAKEFQGNAPDPGTHFVEAVVQLKNLSRESVSLYKVQTSMVKEKNHIGEGQFYKTDGSDVDVVDAPPGTTVTYLDVFEIADNDHPDAILIHPPFVQNTSAIDMLIRL